MSESVHAGYLQRYSVTYLLLVNVLIVDIEIQNRIVLVKPEPRPPNVVTPHKRNMKTETSQIAVTHPALFNRPDLQFQLPARYAT